MVFQFDLITRWSRPLRRLVLLALLFCLAGCAYSPAPVDPAALIRPVSTHIVNAPRVTITVFHLGDQQEPPKCLQRTVRTLQQYCAGPIELQQGPCLPMPLNEPTPSPNRVMQLIAPYERTGPADISLVIASHIDMPNTGQSIRILDGQGNRHRIVVINGENIDAFAKRFWILGRERLWRSLLVHEFGHTLGLPSHRAHTWNDSHCTHPECALYPGYLDKRLVTTTILRLSPPLDYCHLCQNELLTARRAPTDVPLSTTQPIPATEEWTAFFDQVIALNPNCAAAYAARAQFHIYMKSCSSAHRDLDQAIRLKPTTPSFHVLKAQTHQLEKHIADASSEFDQALRLAPDDASIMNEFAWLLATTPDSAHRNASRAIELATRACALTKNQVASYVDTLAAAQAEHGDFSTAVQTQQIAISLCSPSDTTLLSSFRQRLDLYQKGQPYHQ